MKSRTIAEYLEVLYQSLDLGESARLRILAEVRDHLTQAVEEAVAAGTDPREAVEATLSAFGDPVMLAASFRLGPWRSFLRGWRRWRWSVDLLHARHPVSYTALALVALFGLLLIAQSWLFVVWMPVYVAQQIWLAQQIARRSEIGFSARLGALWKEHPLLSQVYNLLFILPLGFYLVLNRAFPPSRSPWNLLVLPAAILLGWLFFWPRARPAAPPLAVDD